jgi:hypothetical protein
MQNFAVWNVNLSIGKTIPDLTPPAKIELLSYANIAELHLALFHRKHKQRNFALSSANRITEKIKRYH